MEVVLRPYDEATDQGYLYSTWTKYCFYSPAEPITLPKGEWFLEKSKAIREILKTARVSIACPKEDPNIILGYIVVRDGKKEWMCVKKVFQKTAIEELLETQIAKDSHEPSQASPAPEPREAALPGHPGEQS